MKSRTDYLDGIRRFVRDKSKLVDDPADHDFVLDAAIDEYSRFRPRELVEEYTSTGVRIYSLPSGWERDFSPAHYRVEYPVSTTANQVSYLEPGMTEIYLDDAATDTHKLRFRDGGEYDPNPASGDKFRVHFKVRHSISEITNTIQDSDFLVVVRLACAELCDIISTRVSQNADASEMSGDLADYRSKADSWSRRAEKFYAKAMEILAPQEEDQKPAFGFATFIDTPFRRSIRSIYNRDESGRKYTD